MRKKPSVAFVGLIGFLAGLAVHESIHYYGYGHLAPLGLHADVIVSSSADLLGVRGLAKIYDAKLTNYGIFPASISVCDYLDFVGLHATMIAYQVERRTSSGEWMFVRYWSNSGSRQFCRPAFEVTGTHMVRRRLWPGQSIQLGQVVPNQGAGFRVGDEGRFTVFLNGPEDRSKTLSTIAFRVEPPR